MSSTLVKRTRLGAIFIVALFVFMTALDYVAGVNSHSMRYAQQVLRESTVLSQQIGTVERVGLSKFWGFRRRSGFSTTRTELSLHATGSKGTASLVLQLEERDGMWRVVSASIPI